MRKLKPTNTKLKYTSDTPLDRETKAKLKPKVDELIKIKENCISLVRKILEEREKAGLKLHTMVLPHGDEYDHLRELSERFNKETQKLSRKLDEADDFAKRLKLDLTWHGTATLRQ